MILKVLKPLMEIFFPEDGGCVLAAPSNKAARLIGGKTLHNLGSFSVSDSLKIFAIKFSSHAQRKKVDAAIGRAGALFIDEWSQMQSILFHAVSLRATYARMDTYQLQLGDYTKTENLFGKVAVLLLAGDHLQLPPVPKSSSLLAGVYGSSLEHQAGVGMFANLWDAFSMATTMCFDNAVLREILRKMRVPGGAKLLQSEWEALLSTKIVGPDDPRLNAAKDFYHSSYLWSIVTMASFLSARTSAAALQELLFYCQAVDTVDQPCSREYYKQMLQVPSLSTTKRIAGICVFHVGMRVRFTATVLPPWAVQDTTGTIVAADFAPSTKLPDRSSIPTELLLQHQPRAIYVKLDDVNLEFLPPSVCAAHALAGFSETCEMCKSHAGLVQLTPHTVRWRFVSSDGFAANVQRTGFPIQPEKACSLYALQGITTDPGLIAHFDVPKRAGPDIRFLIVYVLLSRVRNLKSLLSVNLSDSIREVIESGPPEGLVGEFERIFTDKLAATSRKAETARQALGWN